LINSGTGHRSLTIEDLKAIVINIDYIQQAIDTATPDMFK